MDKKAQAGGIAAIVVVLVFFGSLFYFFAAFDTVDANHVGVKNRIGEITGTMNPGLEHTGVFTRVFQYNLMTRPVLIDMTGAASSAPTAEGQPIYATINLNWRIKKDAVIGLYENIGTNEQIYSNLNIEAKVMQGFKSVTTQYKDALMIQNNRQEVVDKAVEAIIDQLPTDYIIID
ncbi:MAG: hypothetical protein KAJ19_14755, partial [Gammaproteobacteria bacterium]|nr:hypothetical protein [Gammaproteobacteria bacterium]